MYCYANGMSARTVTVGGTSAFVVAFTEHPDEEDLNLISVEVDFPRFILPEVNKHRSLVNNAQSSRAVPVSKVIDAIEDGGFTPRLGSVRKNQSGMQGFEALSVKEYDRFSEIWGEIKNVSIKTARTLYNDLKVHKQHANRILEPFAMQKMVLTGTAGAWDHFHELRDHEDAQPEIRDLSRAIQKAVIDFRDEKDALGVLRMSKIVADHTKFVEQTVGEKYDGAFNPFLTDSYKVLFDRLNRWHLPYITGETIKILMDADLARRDFAKNSKFDIIVDSERKKYFEDFWDEIHENPVLETLRLAYNNSERLIVGRKLGSTLSKNFLKTYENSTDRLLTDFGFGVISLISAARVARVSYRPATLESNIIREDVLADLRLGLRLFSHKPMHATPFEHVATSATGRTPEFSVPVDRPQGWNTVRSLAAGSYARKTEDDTTGDSSSIVETGLVS